jgi:predicted amidohydrolase YtcJ
LKLAVSLGITSMQNASGDDDEVALYAGMPHRVRMSVAMTSGRATPENIAHWSALRTKHATEWLKVKAVKFMIDGVIESKTAAMLEPYDDGKKDVGSPAWKEAEFKAAIARVHRAASKSTPMPSATAESASP